MKRLVLLIVVIVGLLLLVSVAVASNQAPPMRFEVGAASYTALTPQAINFTTGITPTFSAAAAGGNSFVNDGRTFFEVKNTSGATVNVTVTVSYPTVGGGLVIANPHYTIAATSGDRMIGPFDRSYFGSPVYVDYSAVTSVTCAAIKLPD
jgi:hypothetical protein